jgi:hypothetical protein
LSEHDTQLFEERGRLSHISPGGNIYNDLNTIFSLCRMPDSVATCPELVEGVKAHVPSMATESLLMRPAWGNQDRAGAGLGSLPLSQA